MNGQSSLVINNREGIVISGVLSVDNFDETSISATICDSSVVYIEGLGLSIADVNLEKGVLEAKGLVTALYYSDSVKESKGFFKKVFGKR